MTRKLISLAVASAIVGSALLAPQAAFAQNAEIEALKQQLAALSAKIDQLEKSQTQTKKTVDETQATADKTADVVAQEKSRLSFSGDLRYRYEGFDVQYVERNRERDRIRARLAANFRVNDTITGVLALATGSSDPRSANQTLTDQNSRKEIELDLAFVTWAPTADWKLTFGKQRYPWVRTPSYFYDNDVNPEGFAVNYAKGNFFASTFYDWLAERALSFGNVTNASNTDSIMYGAQIGYRIPFSDSVKLTVAGTYFNFDGVQGYNPFFGGSSFGNTTTTSAAVCNRTLGAGVACLAVRLRHHPGIRRPHRDGGRASAAVLRRLRAEHRSRSEPCGRREARHGDVRRHQLRRSECRCPHLGIRRDVSEGREGRALRSAPRLRLR